MTTSPPPRSPQFRRFQLKEISSYQCEILIAHIDTSVPVDHSSGDTTWRLSTAKLVDRGLLEYDRASRPTRSTLTPLGREQLCKLLGRYADALHRAGLRRVTVPGGPRYTASLPGMLAVLWLGYHT